VAYASRSARSLDLSASRMELAPLNPCSTPTGSPCPPAAADGRDLPFDLMLDVLLCVPAKDLCCLRAVCRRWRAATSDPQFVREHAARHRVPLFLINPRDDDAHVLVMDVSGAVVKQIPIPAAHQLLCTRLDLACVVTGWNSCRVLDPATGAVVRGPPALWHGRIRKLIQRNTSFMFGRIASTGEYKVLRIRSQFGEQRFEVFTIGGGADSACWRRLQSPEIKVDACSAVVVDSAVYFLYDGKYFGRFNAAFDPDCITSLDLETEEWRRDLKGPVSGILDIYDEEEMYEYISMWQRLTLAELKGTLVVAYYLRCQADLWFLTDFESGLWEKEYSIQAESIYKNLPEKHSIKPLVVLGDGRLVVHLVPTGLLFIYDQRTNSFDAVGKRHIDAVAMYTGSVLSLPNSDMV
jgi:hypothetical protein